MSYAAIIYYGISFDYDHDLPWKDAARDARSYDDDIRIWWRKEHGYEDPFEIYGEDHNHLPGVTDEMVEEYYAGRKKFHDEHPLPVELSYECHSEYEEPLLIVPGHWQIASDCYSEPVMNMLVNGAKLIAFQRFCDKYGIDHSKIGWYLTGHG